MANHQSAFRGKITAILQQFESMWDGRFGSIKVVPQQIELDKTDNRPSHSSSYRAVPKPREFEKQDVDRMLAMDVVQPVQTEWASTMVLVSKKDGALRFSVYYCKFNAVPIWYLYPISHEDEFID